MMIFLVLACGPQEPIDDVLPATPPCVNGIVTDIDETLTVLDDEFLTQLDDGAYDPLERPAASELMQGYADLGFHIIYVTTRGEDLMMQDGRTARETTEDWLTDHGFPREEDDTFLSNTGSFASGRRATNFKTAAIRRLQEKGWNFAWAYGNAPTDIAAFQNVGIPDDHIFGVGQLSETLGVVPLSDEDAYTNHLAQLDVATGNCPPGPD